MLLNSAVNTEKGEHTGINGFWLFSFFVISNATFVSAKQTLAITQTVSFA